MVVPSNTVANLSCLSDKVVVEEDFENKDVSGWANGRLGWKPSRTGKHAASMT
jgi:hypothetical protein